MNKIRIRKVQQIAIGIVFLMIPFLNTNAQRIGFTIGSSTSSLFNIDSFYFKKDYSFHLGFSSELTETRGELVKEQKSNYGTSIHSKGDFLLLIDLGYGKYLKNGLSIHGEISIGTKREYTNYIDNKFKGGGYYIIHSDELWFGIGSNVGYTFNNYLNAYFGYNSVRKITTGLRISFPLIF